MTYEDMACAIEDALGGATIITHRVTTPPDQAWRTASIEYGDGRSWTGSGPDVLSALTGVFVQVPELEA